MRPERLTVICVFLAAAHPEVGAQEGRLLARLHQRRTRCAVHAAPGCRRLRRIYGTDVLDMSSRIQHNPRRWYVEDGDNASRSAKDAQLKENAAAVGSPSSTCPAREDMD